MEFINLDRSPAFAQLRNEKAPDIKSILTYQRVQNHIAPAGGGLSYNYAAKPVDENILDILQELADEVQLIAKYQAIIDGEVMNTGENRKVLHHLVRGQLGADVVEKGKNLRQFYLDQLLAFTNFANAVRSGAIVGSTGEGFTDVVQIGIGGSDLGPRALYHALKLHAQGDLQLQAHFISNVDPDDANLVLSGLDLRKTLFILVSKSGTTQETLTNQEFVVQTMGKAGINRTNAGKHMIAVTSESSPLAKSPDFLASFFIDDYIGGRYSATSAVGGVILSLAFGGNLFRQLLAGAAEGDRSALNKDIKKNAALLDALIGVYERNVLSLPQTAVLPYSQALFRFPAHLQQLDMESNGKRVNRTGETLTYQTGPVVFGEPGTNGQHSFYQLLHQGTDPVPLQFIGFRKAQSGFDIEFDGSTSQKKLNANLAAQVVAFALGQASEHANKHFPGNRPASLLYGDQLTPETLGALLAHFENKVMFQGLTWNINSFDQEGVQLGKTLAKKVLAGAETQSVLAAYAKLLDL